MRNLRTEIRQVAIRLAPPMALIPPAGLTTLALAITLLGGCRGPEPELQLDEGLSAAFSAGVGAVAEDVGVSSFSFYCDGIAHRVKVEYSVSTAAISRDETVWSATPCSGTGRFLTAVQEFVGGYSVYGAKQYGIELVLDEWKKSIAPRFGTLARSEAGAAFFEKSYAKRFKDLDVDAVDMVCDDTSNVLRYRLMYLKPPKGRGLNIERIEGATSMQCPAEAEKGHPLFQAVVVRGPFKAADAAPPYRYRVAMVKGLSTEVLSQFLAEMLEKSGRQQTF